MIPSNFKLLHHNFFFLLGIIFSFYPLRVSSQIKSDNTIDTQINQNNNVAEITGGKIHQNNLFHSFQDFSVPTGNEAFFNNATEISNIFSRVTGGQLSNIDGLIRANGSANLFLINPAGIVFSDNAKLDIGGSFLATTADSIEFSHDRFSAITKNIPTLTINMPIGLGFGDNPGNISIQGVKNPVVIEIPSFRINTPHLTPGIQVNPRENISLIGGNINFRGGGLQAPGGQIELGSVGNNETVNLVKSEDGWFNAHFDNITNLENISLAQAALVDVSGQVGGQINLSGRQIVLDDGSAILANTSLPSNSAIEINATELLELKGTSGANSSNEFYSISLIGADIFSGEEGQGNSININTAQLQIFDAGQIRAVNFSDSFNMTTGDINLNATSILLSGTNNIDGLVSSLITTSGAIDSNGNGGNVNIASHSLRVEDGARIKADTFGGGQSGQLHIVADDIQLKGANPFIDFFTTGLSTSVSPEGTTDSVAGDIEIETKSLNILDGARINSNSLGQGSPGNINIQAEELNIVGFSPFNNKSASGIIASVSPIMKVDRTNLTSEAGSILINTHQLRVLNGARIQADTTAGDSGSIMINAQDIELNGTRPKVGDFVGGLSTSSNPQAFGNGGNININANSLKIANGSIIRAISLGDGDAGNIQLDTHSLHISGFDRYAKNPLASGRVSKINTGTVKSNGGAISVNSDVIEIDNLGRIEASTRARGLGGNIFLDTQNIILNHQSSIGSNANNGNGGNINIDSDTILGLENSDITANAVGGNGGNININSDYILGFQARAQLTPLSDITASSELGLSGKITINSPDTLADDEALIAVKKLDFNSTEDLIKQSCFQSHHPQSVGTIVDRGRGGLPENPENYFDAPEFLAPSTPIKSSLTSNSIPQIWQPGEPIIEANTVQVTPNGRQFLIAQSRLQELNSQICPIDNNIGNETSSN